MCLEIAEKGKKVWADTPLYKRSEVLHYADAVEKNKIE